MIRIGINGFGRIGQTIARILHQDTNLHVVIVAINDVATTEHLAYSLRKDSIRSQESLSATASENTLHIGDRAIAVFHEPSPADIPWSSADVDVVIDATGKFRSGAAARQHIRGTVKKVIVSASADNPDAFIVYGTNHHTYQPDHHHVVSPASCGVNALVTLAKVLSDEFGLSEVDTNVILAAQGWQRIHDAAVGTSRNDPRLGRSMSQNIIPHPYVVGDLVTNALPQIGDISYSYYVVPTPIGSLANLSGKLGRPATAEEVNRAMLAAAKNSLKGILAYDADSTVSSDVRGNTASCLFDPTSTQVTPDGRVKVMGWFDGEWGFASRLIDLAQLVGPVS